MNQTCWLKYTSCSKQRHRRKARNFSEWRDSWIKLPLCLDPAKRLLSGCSSLCWRLKRSGGISYSNICSLNWIHILLSYVPVLALLKFGACLGEGKCWQFPKNRVTQINSRTNITFQQSANYPPFILEQILTLSLAIRELMPFTSLTRSYTTVTNIRTVLISAKLLILCFGNILVTWKEPLLYIRKKAISYHTVLIPWSKKISCQKITTACIQEFDSFFTVGRFVSIDCPLTNKEK